MKEVFTKYDLISQPSSGTQFEMMELPGFFMEHGQHPFEPHIHSFYQIIWFKGLCVAIHKPFYVQ